MIPIPSGVRVAGDRAHGHGKGFASLSLQVQEVLRHDPLSGHLFCFRGRRGDLLKVIWHDGQGACLFTKGWSGAAFCGRAPPTARRDDLAGPARLPALRHRLASSPGNLASDLGWLRIRLAGDGGCDSIGP